MMDSVFYLDFPFCFFSQMTRFHHYAVETCSIEFHTRNYSKFNAKKVELIRARAK